LLAAHLLVQPNYDNNTYPLVSTIIILKPLLLVSVASPLRPPSLNVHATYIYTGRDLSISDSLEIVAVSIHIPFSLYLILHRHTDSNWTILLILLLQWPLHPLILPTSPSNLRPARRCPRSLTPRPPMRHALLCTGMQRSGTSGSGQRTMSP
jgi:hypothetical protein